MGISTKNRGKQWTRSQEEFYFIKFGIKQRNDNMHTRTLQSACIMKICNECNRQLEYQINGYLAKNTLICGENDGES